MARGERTTGNRLIGVALGGLGAIAVAVVLVPFRDEIDNTNLALILVLVVVIAAILGGRTAAAVAAVAATLAFDFFLTPPYLSMRIDSADDVETMLILLAVGLLVGEVAARGRRSRRGPRACRRCDRTRAPRRRGDRDRERADGSGRRSSRPSSPQLLRLHDCWLEFPPFLWVLPRLERGGTIGVHEHAWSGGGFALPEDGVELAVVARKPSDRAARADRRPRRRRDPRGAGRRGRARRPAGERVRDGERGEREQLERDVRRD